MNLSKRVYTRTKQEFFTQHLMIINPFLPDKLHPREIEVLACLMSISGDHVDKDRLCKSARKEVRDKMKLSYGGFGNYITIFEDKKFIKYNEDGTAYIPSLLFPRIPQQGYSFQISILEDE